MKGRKGYIGKKRVLQAPFANFCASLFSFFDELNTHKKKNESCGKTSINQKRLQIPPPIRASATKEKKGVRMLTTRKSRAASRVREIADDLFPAVNLVRCLFLSNPCQCCLRAKRATTALSTPPLSLLRAWRAKEREGGKDFVDKFFRFALKFIQNTLFTWYLIIPQKKKTAKAQCGLLSAVTQILR